MFDARNKRLQRNDTEDSKAKEEKVSVQSDTFLDAAGITPKRI